MNKNFTNSRVYGAGKGIVSLSLFIFFALPASAQLYLNPGALVSVTTSSLLSVQSNIQINTGAGSTLDNSGDILVTGNFTNNSSGFLQNGMGTVHFQGTKASQRIGGSFPITGTAAFYTIEINNGYLLKPLVDMSNNIEVKNQLQFNALTTSRLRTDTVPISDGSFPATHYEVYISNTMPTAISGDVNTWAAYYALRASGIMSKFIEGRLRWNTTAGNSYVFPIGTLVGPAPVDTGSFYGQQFTQITNSVSGIASVSFTQVAAPIDLSLKGIHDCIGSARTPGGIGTLISCIVAHGHWNLTPPAASSMAVNLGEHGAKECQPASLDHTFLTSTDNGTTWIVNMTNGNNPYCNPGVGPAYKGTPIDSILKRVTVTDPNSWLAEGSSVEFILPITLLSFTAEKYGDEQESLLKWSTATEQNSKDFELEWSPNGINWQTIGIVDAAGNSETQIDYSFIHTSPVTGVNYYQLKEVDLNNNATFSDVREVTFTGNGSITITPNPAVNNAMIHCSYVNPHIAFEVINVLGQRISSGLLTSNSLPLDLRTYPSGMYYFRFYVNNTTQVIPVVKQQ